MKRIQNFQFRQNQAVLWYLGQAGYIIRAGDATVAIDPYLSDSVKAVAPSFGRLIPVPINPEDLAVDLYLVTHDHLDHLDPETLRHYPHKNSTMFVSPHLAAKKLRQVGVPKDCIRQVDVGEKITLKNITINGVFALPTGPDVLDTTGYRLTFENGRSLYHTSDTAFTPLLLEAVPEKVEVLLIPINGKWGNLNVGQAVEMTAKVDPHYVLPNHYDMMALNSADPEMFRRLCQKRNLAAKCIIQEIMKPFVWE